MHVFRKQNTNRFFFSYPSLNQNKNDLDQQAKNEIENEILNNEIGRRYEVWFKHTQWKLNDDDGKTSLAKFLMKNFLYTKVTNQIELDCVEHNLEIESCKVQDLTSSSTVASGKNAKNASSKATNQGAANPANVMTSLFDEATLLNNYDFESDSIAENEDEKRSEDDEYDYSDMNYDTVNNDEFYHSSDAENNEFSEENEAKTSSSTTASKTKCPGPQSSRINHQLYPANSSHTVMFRIYCKERPPVGSIPVFEHLELNVSPLLIKFTNRFYNMMMRFFFENNQTTGQVLNAQSSSYYLLSNHSSNTGLASLANLNNAMNSGIDVASSSRHSMSSGVATSANSTLQRNAPFPRNMSLSEDKQALSNIINSNLSKWEIFAIIFFV